MPIDDSFTQELRSVRVVVVSHCNDDRQASVSVGYSIIIIGHRGGGEREREREACRHYIIANGTETVGKRFNPEF
jgi:hypothetical protein